MRKKPVNPVCQPVSSLTIQTAKRQHPVMTASLFCVIHFTIKTLNSDPKEMIGILPMPVDIERKRQVAKMNFLLNCLIFTNSACRFIATALF